MRGVLRFFHNEIVVCRCRRNDFWANNGGHLSLDSDCRHDPNHYVDAGFRLLDLTLPIGGEREGEELS